MVGFNDDRLNHEVYNAVNTLLVNLKATECKKIIFNLDELFDDLELIYGIEKGKIISLLGKGII